MNELEMARALSPHEFEVLWHLALVARQPGDATAADVFEHGYRHGRPSYQQWTVRKVANVLAGLRRRGLVTDSGRRWARHGQRRYGRVADGPSAPTLAADREGRTVVVPVTPIVFGGGTTGTPPILFPFLERRYLMNDDAPDWGDLPDPLAEFERKMAELERRIRELERIPPPRRESMPPPRPPRYPAPLPRWSTDWSGS